MQQVLATFFKKTLIVLLVGLISIFSFAIGSQPSFAATSTMQEMDKPSQSVSDRERAYEEQLEAEKNPDKVFEENVKEYRKENPGEGIVEKAVEGVEKVADKVTGKD
jgi:hypothetical protein